MHVSYGDSSHTADGKYIIASFRADANLSWVSDLRSFLNLSELKYRDYAPLERKHYVAGNAPLYRNMIRGLADAELTIIDQERSRWGAYFRYRDKGARWGEDYGIQDIHRIAADEMIRDSPLGLPVESYGPLAMRAAVARAELATFELTELPEFDSTAIHQRSGGKFKDAIVLSARAHSMLSPTEFQELRYLAMHPYMHGSLSGNMKRAAALGRVFDHEHPKSVPILNELVSRVAEARGVPHRVAVTLSLKEPVREESSKATDHLQAADFAAGWAAELLTATDSDFRALASKVRWVSVNGIVCPS